jgi:hypothetical protein
VLTNQFIRLTRFKRFDERNALHKLNGTHMRSSHWCSNNAFGIRPSVWLIVLVMVLSLIISFRLPGPPPSLPEREATLEDAATYYPVTSSSDRDQCNDPLLFITNLVDQASPDGDDVQFLAIDQSVLDDRSRWIDGPERSF